MKVAKKKIVIQAKKVVAETQNNLPVVKPPCPTTGRGSFGGKRGINGIKPGETRNPNGRPPSHKCIPDILRKIGNDPIPQVFMEQLRLINPKIQIKPENNNMRFGMLLRTYYDAIRGDKDARNFIAERTEGKVSERGISEGKGEILEAIDKLLDSPVTTEEE